MHSGHCVRHLFLSVSLAAVAFLAGCSSTTDGVTARADDAVQPTRAEKYPDFSAPLDSAIAQMTDQEAARQEAQLSALARQRQSGRLSEAEYRRRVQELRLLGQQASK